MSVRAEIAELRRDMFELKEAMRTQLFCGEPIEFIRCPFPEVLDELIERFDRPENSHDGRALAAKLRELRGK